MESGLEIFSMQRVETEEQKLENRVQTRIPGKEEWSRQPQVGCELSALGTYGMTCGGHLLSPIQAYFGIDLRQKQITVNRG